MVASKFNRGKSTSHNQRIHASTFAMKLRKAQRSSPNIKLVWECLGASQGPRWLGKWGNIPNLLNPMNHRKTFGKPWENGGLMVISWDLMRVALWSCQQLAIEHGPFIVSFPGKKCDFSVMSFVGLPYLDLQRSKGIASAQG